MVCVAVFYLRFSPSEHHRVHGPFRGHQGNHPLGLSHLFAVSERDLDILDGLVHGVQPVLDLEGPHGAGQPVSEAGSSRALFLHIEVHLDDESGWQKNGNWTKVKG